MFEYKSEVLKVSYKLFKASINSAEVEELDKLINERTADGWEFVCHSFMGGNDSPSSGLLVTFRKPKSA